MQQLLTINIIFNLVTGLGLKFLVFFQVSNVHFYFSKFQHFPWFSVCTFEFRTIEFYSNWFLCHFKLILVWPSKSQITVSMTQWCWVMLESLGLGSESANAMTVWIKEGTFKGHEQQNTEVHQTTSWISPSRTSGVQNSFPSPHSGSENRKEGRKEAGSSICSRKRLNQMSLIKEKGRICCVYISLVSGII